MKTYLEARPVYLQKVESIYGHFTIRYLALIKFLMTKYPLVAFFIFSIRVSITQFFFSYNDLKNHVLEQFKTLNLHVFD